MIIEDLFVKLKKKNQQRATTNEIFNINYYDFLEDENFWEKSHRMFNIQGPSQAPFLKNLGDLDKINFLSQQDFKEKFGLTWQEGIEIPILSDVADQFPTNIISDISHEDLMQKVKTIIAKPEDRVALYQINEQVGHGVIALKTIGPHTVIAVYSGSLSSNPNEAKGGYAFQYFHSDFFIKPKNFRGLASFFQHLPTAIKFKDPHQKQALLNATGQLFSVEEVMLEEELYTIQFNSPAIYDNLATANLNCEYLVYDDVPLIVFITNRQIEAGEQLGFDYGHQYWLAQGFSPEYFTKKAEIIPPNCYRRNFGRLCFDGYDYTGKFDVLLKELENPGLYSYLQMNDRFIQVSKVKLEAALLKAKALHPDEIKFNRFEKNKATRLTFDELDDACFEFITILKNKSLEFNRSHCQALNKSVGYWTFSELKKLEPTLPDHYKEGYLNSKLFIKKNAFYFEKLPDVSASSAMQSLIAKDAFGVIDSAMWEVICYLLAIQDYLGNEKFDALFPKLLLKKEALNPKLLSLPSKKSTNLTGFCQYNNHPDYKFRHPFSNYDHLDLIRIGDDFLCFGRDQLMGQDDVENLLKEKYYIAQTDEELTYISQVSANCLLDYLLKESEYSCNTVTRYQINTSALCLLKITNNPCDLEAWIDWTKERSYSIIECDVFNYPESKLDFNVFTSDYHWRIQFINGEFNSQESFKFPAKSLSSHTRCGFLFDHKNETIYNQYSYRDRCQVQHSHELLAICTASLAYFSNVNFYKKDKSFVKAFQYLQELRQELLEQKQEKNLHIKDLDCQLNKNKEAETKKIEDKKNTALESFSEKMIIEMQKIQCMENKARYCQQLGLPVDASKEKIVKIRKELLFFWHPDRNKSIIANEMTQQINHETSEALRLSEKIEHLEKQSNTDNLLLPQNRTIKL